MSWVDQALEKLKEQHEAEQETLKQTLDNTTIVTEPLKPIYAETPEQFTAIEQLALAGFYYITRQLETPGQYVQECHTLLEFAQKAVEAFEPHEK